MPALTATVTTTTLFTSNASNAAHTDEWSSCKDSSKESTLDELRRSLEAFSISTSPQSESPYEGNLLQDIVIYRSLRSMQLQGCLPSEFLSELCRLEEQLRLRHRASSAGKATLRTYERFETALPAVIWIPETRLRIPVGVEDISAGGLRASARHSFTPGQHVIFSVPHPEEELSIEFPSRIAWVRSNVCGLMFAGAAAVGGIAP